MKVLPFLIPAVILVQAVFAQKELKPLSHSRTTSVFTYLYQLDDKGMQAFYGKHKVALEDCLPGRPLDSGRTGFWKDPELKAGNYFKVYAGKAAIQYELIEKHSAFVELLDNRKDLRFLVRDAQGREVHTAAVTVNGHRPDFDFYLAAYRRRRWKSGDVIKVAYQGVSNFFQLTQEKKIVPYIRGESRFSRPGKVRIVQPSGDDEGEAKLWSGYIAFNKPIYRPGDTVRFKAFVFGPGHDAIKNPMLSVRIKVARDDSDSGKVISRVQAYRPGAFESSFVLSDGLKLRLDENYSLILSPAGTGKKADREQISAGFKYEEYSLKDNSFTVRTDGEHAFRGKPFAIYLKAVDENSLSVMDGRVKLILSATNIDSFGHRKMFIPDTLWTREVRLDPSGETRVVIPDSIFPDAGIACSLECAFLNSNNEKHVESAWFRFGPLREASMTLNGDSIKLVYQENGRALSRRFWLEFLDLHGKVLDRRHVILPLTLKILPEVASYHTQGEGIEQILPLTGLGVSLSPEASRSADSILIKVDNPNLISYRYTVFKNNRILDRGSVAGTSFSYRRKVGHSGNYSLLLNYTWAGEFRKLEVPLEYRDKQLAITLLQPPAVFPGQTAALEIEVKDAAGRAVPGADLNAFALTSRFRSFQVPDLPYFGKVFKTRKLRKELALENLAEKGAFALNWKRWSRQMGLDSIAWFRFTHPQGLFKQYEPAEEGISQIAPFAVQGGDILPVYVIWIDDQPVYLSQTDQLERYSFRLTEGFHKISLRTLKQRIDIDSVEIKKGKKLILSFDASRSDISGLNSVKMPDSLSTDESQALAPYFIKVEGNFAPQMAEVIQDSLHLLLIPPEYGGARFLTGPLLPQQAGFRVFPQQARIFIPQAFYVYEFSPGLLQKTSIPGTYPFETRLNSLATRQPDYRQYAISNHEAGRLWEKRLDSLQHYQYNVYNSYVPEKGNGILRIELARHSAAPRPGEARFVKCILVLKPGDPYFLRLYPGQTTNFGSLQPGKYRLFFLLHGNQYVNFEAIAVRPGGTNFYSLALDSIRPPGDFSLRLGSALDQQAGRTFGSDDLADDILPETGSVAQDSISFRTRLSGRIVDPLGQPVVGATVSISRSGRHTTSTGTGNFSLFVPARGRLKITEIGFNTLRLDLPLKSGAEIVLQSMTAMLSEVRYAGRGSDARLSGRAPGVYVQQKRRAGSSMLREVEELQDAVPIMGTTGSAGQKPLYVIDGILSKELALDAGQIGRLEVLKGDAALALYGEGARYGVIVVTSKAQLSRITGPAANGNGQAGNRHNFSDYAWWQPRLMSDAQGKARFSVHFPDDITNWRTVVLGVAGRSTGTAVGNIKAYKTVSASLALPEFAIAGDQIAVLGKVMNYTGGAATLRAGFTVAGSELSWKQLQVKDVHLDTLSLKIKAAPALEADTLSSVLSKDSLLVEYGLQQENYRDGESRKIPVFKPGVLESKGSFASLEGDTSLKISINPALGPLTLRAEASVLPVLLKECEHVRNYEYLCNEQLASKLKTLLAEKRIDSRLQLPFKFNREISALTAKLLENLNEDGTWGWWKNGPGEMWISLHVAESLLDAGQSGFSAGFDKQRLLSRILLQLNNLNGIERLDAIRLAHRLDTKSNFSSLVSAFEKDLKFRRAGVKVVQISTAERLKLMLVKAELDLPVDLDSLLNMHRQSMYGSWYWGTTAYHLTNNSVETTLMAYRILKLVRGHEALLPKLRNYFLEQRQDGYWRNTYESARILETVLPDLLAAGESIKPALLLVDGAKTAQIKNFPYTTTLDQAGVLNIRKSGTLPVYLSAYQQFWNTKPQKSDRNFKVDTWFESKGQKTSDFKAGEPVILIAEVTARADGDYVMVEIPIPAVCGYENKEQAYRNSEVHREYFKNRVSIFCRKMAQGKYRFEVSLMPRFAGSCTLNAARAELMYFPVFSGREALKHVTIQP